MLRACVCVVCACVCVVCACVCVVFACVCVVCACVCACSLMTTSDKLRDVPHGGFNAFQAGIFILKIDVMAVGHMYNGMHVRHIVRTYVCLCHCGSIFQFPLPFYFTAYNYIRN